MRLRHLWRKGSVSLFSCVRFPLHALIEPLENVLIYLAPIDFVEHFVAAARIQLYAQVFYAGFLETRISLPDTLAVIAHRVVAAAHKGDRLIGIHFRNIGHICDIPDSLKHIPIQPCLRCKSAQFNIRALAEERLADTKLDKVHIIDACVAGALFDACLSWLLDDRALPKEELIDTVSEFLSGGLGQIYDCR